jgi:putative endonuclease
MRTFYVYILASRRNGTLYVGVTAHLSHRIQEHKQKMLPGFTSKYGVNRLVYYEKHKMIIEAIKREKQIKRWRRAWKIALIEKINPEWEDLCRGDYIAYPRPKT